MRVPRTVPQFTISLSNSIVNGFNRVSTGILRFSLGFGRLWAQIANFIGNFGEFGWRRTTEAERPRIAPILTDETRRPTLELRMECGVEVEGWRGGEAKANTEVLASPE